MTIKEKFEQINQDNKAAAGDPAEKLEEGITRVLYDGCVFFIILWLVFSAVSFVVQRL